MILLDVEAIRKHFGPDPVLDGVTFQVRPGERIGLVGPNGCGKTTLMKIIAGDLDSDGGTCVPHGSVHVGYLQQQPDFPEDHTLWDEAKSALAGLVALEEESLSVADAIAETPDAAEHERLAARYDHLQQELHRRDAYNLDHKVRRVLGGLGFQEDRFEQPVCSLSGGEQNRVILVKLLLAEPNLMLLDEPSNHLDIEATEWLESFLLESSAAMIVVSHDRCFLDKVTNRTFELFRGTVDSFSGNFSAYWRQKAERLLVQQRTYEKQQTEIAKTKEFIRRNSYGQKHQQAEDRRKKLQRIVPVELPREITSPPMGFGTPSRSGDFVLRAKKLAKAYDRPLFHNVGIEVMRGERWGVLGPNGCGKTTLLRCLLGLVEPDEGQVTFGTGVDIAYFDQQLATLDDELEAVEVVRPPKGEFVEQQRRDLLARFGLTGDTALQPVKSLSGGERCRVALARLAATRANLLVLDEPTNHLDLWARDALEQSLTQFEGTALFVSHDRYFLDRVADHILVVEPDRVRIVEGNYQAYRRLTSKDSDRSSGQQAAAAKPSKPNASGRNASGGAASGGAAKQSVHKKRRFPYRKVADIEVEISQRETAVEDLQNVLAQGDIHRDGDRVRAVKAEITEHQQALKKLYEHWEEAGEMNW